MRGDRAVMARTSFWMYSAGATLALVSLLLPSDGTRNRPAMLITIAAAYLVSTVPLVGHTKLPDWAFEALTLVGTLLISSGVYFAGATGETYGLLYFWIVIYACYFFAWQRAAFHIVTVAAAYALVLDFQGSPSFTSIAWVITVGTLAVAGAVILALTGRLAQLVNDLVASEAKSRERGTRLAAVLQSAPVAIIDLDSHDNVRTWNIEAETMFGWAADQVRGRPSPVRFQLLESRDGDEHVFGDPSLREAMAEHRDGGTHSVAFKSAPVMDDDGHQIGRIELAVDITERRRLEEELRRAQQMEAVARLGGAVAHDFNNILLAVRSYSWLLKDSIDRDHADQHGCVAEIEKAVDRAANLTKQLLAFSQRPVEAPTAIDLNQVVQDVSGMLRPLVGDAVRLVIRPSRQTAPVLADAIELEQVIVNLAVNAQQAMPGGGSLLIEVLAPLPGEVLFTSDDQNSAEVVLRVTDTGIGLDPTQQRLMFEPFYTTRKAEGGTGLGLSTVYGIVTRHSGKIDVTSKPGSGTTFTIRFPRCHTNDTPPPSIPDTAPTLRGTETILLVEDDHSVRIPLQRTLEHYGYTVLTATNGQAALDILPGCSDTPDLLITDVVMPTMCGDDLVKRLQELRPHTRVLYISGYVPTAFGFDADDPGASPGDPLIDYAATEAAFLQKPFTIHQLATAVRTLLELPPNHPAPARTDAPRDQGESTDSPAARASGVS